MAGRPRTRSDSEVFAAVIRAVGRRGPRQLTLSDVAQEVGLAPSTLAERFGSKRELMLAAARASTGQVEATFARSRAHGDAPLDALLRALVELAGGVRTRAAFANHLAVLQLDLADPDFQRVAAEHARAMRAEIGALVEDARAEGRLTAAADPDRLSRALQVAYNGGLVAWAVEGAGPLADSLREDLGAVLAPWRAERRD